jgi:hypothetical protein
MTKGEQREVVKKVNGKTRGRDSGKKQKSAELNKENTEHEKDIRKYK